VEDLLPYYESELGFLRRYSREFSERYPKVAGRLLMGGEVCEDPHIERMIQSFALLSSRISKRLDDDYPEFTEALFEVLYPHYLRSFPSCSIARVHFGAGIDPLLAAAIIPRHTNMTAKGEVKGVRCHFRTAYPVTVAPIALSHARFSAIPEAPGAVQLPPNTTSSVSITIARAGKQIGLAQLGMKTVRVFIDGEPSFCAALRDALFVRTVKAYVEGDKSGRWLALPRNPVTPAGFDEDDSLIPFPARSHPAYRLLTEYYCFPEKFNFFDIDMTALAAVLPSGCNSVTLHLALSGLPADSNAARMLGTLTTNNMLLGCTPVVNLFQQAAEPTLLTHTTASYPVLPDLKPYGFEVYSIDSVKMVRQKEEGGGMVDFRPFYSLRHGETPEEKGHYWVMRRNEVIAQKSPGHETEISIVDIDFDPAAIETNTLSLELTCTNRDLPALLTYGMLDGDLGMVGGVGVRAINFLRKPTNSYRFERGRGAHWRLISHLSLNHLSLAEGGLEAFREMLALYDLPRSPISRRQIGGITAIGHKAVNAWLAGDPFACLARGIEVRLTIDEEAFVGSGIHTFTHIIERFLGLYVNANSFTQLVIVSNKSGEELVRCTPRSGDLSLV